MFYGAASITSILVGLVVLFIGVRMLFKGTWFWGWLRGMGGVFFIALAIGLGFIALDLHSYQQLLIDKPIATVSFKQVERQKFIASVAATDSGETSEFYLSGDQWQIDARVIRWKGALRSFGGKPGYRLDRISGRYSTLEDERTQQRTVYALREQEYGIDLWAWAHEQNQMPLMDAAYGSATFLPMADGALFEVALSHSGLVAKPLNAAAEKAVNYWRE